VTVAPASEPASLLPASVPEVVPLLFVLWPFAASPPVAFAPASSDSEDVSAPGPEAEPSLPHAMTRHAPHVMLTTRVTNEERKTHAL